MQHLLTFFHVVFHDSFAVMQEENPQHSQLKEDTLAPRRA